MTALRQRLGQLRTRTINRVKHLLRKHNLEQEQPAKGIDTKRTRKWLAELALGPIDRLEMDLLLAQWKLWDEQIEKLDAEIRQASGGEQDGRRGGDDSRLCGLQQPGVGRRGSARSSGSRGRRAWRTIGG